MTFDPGFSIDITAHPLGFVYGPGVFGPQPEIRALDAIRPSLRDPSCSGPDPVYAIAMDVGKLEHRPELQRRMLLLGAATYASGRLGEEPVRSQGHVHARSHHSGWSPPELYEIWSGEAFIYMQEFAAGDPGRCFAIHAKPGDCVLVPPGWAHATISADTKQQLTFGALCDREYGFLYDEVRRRRGLAWYPIVKGEGRICWERNPNYLSGKLEVRPSRKYPEFGLLPGRPLYSQLEEDFGRFQWISEPSLAAELWTTFEP